GLRNPYAQISPLAWPTNGLSCGTVYLPGVLTSRRSTLPIRLCVMSCPLPPGLLGYQSSTCPNSGVPCASPSPSSSRPPPSPIDRYSMPSAPNATVPPSWLNCG